jgi:hypothetical protein
MATKLIVDSIDSSLSYEVNASYTFVMDKIHDLLRGNLGYAKFYLVGGETAIIPQRLAQNAVIKVVGDRPPRTFENREEREGEGLDD